MRGCPANGEPILSDPDPVPLAAGAVAPFDGDLWPVVKSIRMTLRAETCQERARIDIERAARQFAAELTFLRATHEAEGQADAQRIQILRAALDDAVPWYTSPVFVALVAVAVTLAAVVAAAYVTAPLARQY